MNNASPQPARNILFIMCDQLRQDYLSCYGHRTLSTPNIDALARRGVRFANACCNAPLCAPSRASFYTGRYQSSHGVMGNDDATRLGEVMLGDYLRPLGYRTAVVGKTHSHKSETDIANAGVDPDSSLAQNARTGGFEPYEWHEGLYPDPIFNPNHGYTRYLREQGYTEPNPWDRCANSSVDPDGNLHSGWVLRSSQWPANVAEEHSETAFTTSRALDFIRETGDQPWCLHLSYIKPHWPVIAPEPYRSMFGQGDVQQPIRAEAERLGAHPVVDAFMQLEYSQSYVRDQARAIVIPAYMALVKQIDDHIGRLMAFLEESNQLDSTLIVFTADHGDYLGDHWLGEKDLFHRQSVNIPMIVVEPDQSANQTRGTVCEDLVEGVDIVPTFIEYAGGSIPRERIEGRSLLPLLHDPKSAGDWREFTISEIDYSERGARKLLGLDPYQCRATMIADRDWKYIHYEGFPPQLFDLTNDPDELIDLGTDDTQKPVRQRMEDALGTWRRSLKNRIGLDYDYLLGQGPERDETHGFIIGRW